MALCIKDLLPAPEVVEYNGVEIPVRGLRVSDLAFMLTQYKQEIETYRKQSEGKVLSEQGVTELIILFPTAMAALIAKCTDTQGQEEDIKNLPIAVQVELVVTIWKLSVPDLGKLTKVIETVALLVKQP